MKEEKRQELLEKVKGLEGLSFNDWERIKRIVDTMFRKKEKEFEKNLKLSSDNAETVIREQFG